MVREKEIPAQLPVNKPLFIRLQIPAGEAVSAPPLSSTLGQVQINSSDFCKVFNAFSLQNYEQGVLLNIDLFKNNDNTYYFIIRGISLPYIFFQVADQTRYIPVEVLYDCFIIKIFSISSNLNFNTSKLLFSSMRAMGFSVILLLPILFTHYDYYQNLLFSLFLLYF
jgi:hypothetical protein